MIFLHTHFSRINSDHKQFGTLKSNVKSMSQKGGTAMGVPAV